MKAVKRIIICLVIVVILTLPVASAIEAPPSPTTINSAEATSARAEETEWRYRIYNGTAQRRLWSITYEKWLTEWEDCVV